MISHSHSLVGRRVIYSPPSGEKEVGVITAVDPAEGLIFVQFALLDGSKACYASSLILEDGSVPSITKETPHE